MIIFLVFGSLLNPVEEMIQLEPARTEYLLSGKVVKGTCEIDSLDIPWMIEGNNLILAHPLQDSMRITVKYMGVNQHQPYWIHNPGSESRFINPEDKIKDLARFGEENLDVHGAKTFSITVSDAGISDIDQGLTVDVSGELSGVEVEAYITDEEASFVPSGTTERIEEFDRIRIALSQNKWSVNLGDLDVKYRIPGFGDINRRLSGASGNAILGKVETSGALGINGTRRRFQSISLEDGKHGPYPVGQQGSEQPLIPGSEKVWMNGEIMERGADKDYTIDYLTGELNFTPGVYVSTSARVEIEYTYSGANYRSDNEFASADISGFTGWIYREADTPYHLYYSWSEQQQMVLDSAKSGMVELPGYNYVGEGNGTYVMEDSHFVWAGQGGGDYIVSFLRTDSGIGSYILDADSGFFRYLGPESGNYEPLIQTSLPHREEAAGIGYEKDFGFLNVAASLAGSRVTPNLYAKTDQMFGHTHNVGLGINLDGFNGGIEHWLRTEHSWLPSEEKDAQVRERWNLDTLSQVCNEQDLRITGRIWDSVFITVDAGHLGDSVQYYRAGGNIDSRDLSMQVQWLNSRQLAVVDIHPLIWIFSPRTKVTYQYFPYQFRRFIEPVVELGLTTSSGIYAGVGASRRYDQEATAGNWQDTLYYDRLWTSLDHGGDEFEISAITGFERYSPLLDTSAQAWQGVYTDLNTSYTPSNRIRISAFYSQHFSASRSVLVEYLPVDPGTGDYTRDPETGEYVQTENGDYQRIVNYEENQELASERKANLGIQLNYKPVRFSSNVSYFSSSVDHRFLAQGKINLLPYNKLFNLVAWPSFAYQELPSWTGSSEVYEELKTRLEIRSRITDEYLLRIRAQFADENRRRDDTPLRSRLDYYGELAPMLNLCLMIEPYLGAGVLYASEPRYYAELGEVTIRKFWTGFDVEKTIAGWRFGVGGKITSRISDSGEDLPFLISADDPEGLTFNWNAGIERSLGKGLRLRGEYEGTMYPDERGLVNGIEVIAGMYF